MNKLINFFKEYKHRQWLYKVLAAVLALCAMQGFISAEQSGALLEVIVAVLNLGGAGAFTLASANARPSDKDTTE